MKPPTESRLFSPALIPVRTTKPSAASSKQRIFLFPLLLFIIFFFFVGGDNNSPFVSAAVFNRYKPSSSSEFGSSSSKTTMVVQRPPKKLEFEMLAGFHATPAMKTTARQAIAEVFSGWWPLSGDESHHIGEQMEKRFDGFWDVYIFDADFDAAYTTVRRSPAYMLWRVNDRSILIAKQGKKGGGQEANSILLR